MKRGVVTGLLLVVLGAGAPLAGQSARSLEVQMKAAQQKAEVEGDLKGAIEQYKKVAASADGNRMLAAQALVRMAECYQKLGDNEARKIYERLLRDFADQKEAVAIAQARLGTAGLSTNALVTRRVWTGPNATNLGRVSPDGRSIAFTDWETGDLALHDLTTGQDRRVTNKGEWGDSPEYALFPVIAHDGNRAAYAWLNREFRGELRVAALNGDAKPRVVFAGHDVQYVDVCGWMPDDKWLSARIVRMDRTVQFGLVSVADGAVRLLKSIEWRGGCAMPSPDGKYLAYDAPVGDNLDQSEIYIIAADASRETPAVVHPADDKVIGWSPDGAFLLFKSTRSGAPGVWALPVADGRPRAEPRLIKADINLASLGVTRSGAFYYAVGAFTDDVYVAAIDFENATVLSAPTRIAQQYVGSNRAPDWSPDGKYLSYLSFRQLPTGFNPVVGIYSTTSGTVRELKPNLPVFAQPFWSPDSRSLIGTGSDRKGRAGIYQVDAQTGQATPLVLVEAGQQVGRGTGDGINARGWTRDDTGLLIERMEPKSGRRTLVVRDLTTGRDREFRRNEVLGRATLPGLLTVSPDGKHRVAARVDQSSKSTTVQIADVQSGTTRELFRVSPPEGVGPMQWTPDGRFIVVIKTIGSDASRNELWRIAAATGDVRRIDLPVPVRNFLRFHPDGRRVAFPVSSSDVADEVWVMENFLPSPSTRRTTAAK